MAAVHDGYVLQKVLRVFVLLWSAQVAIGRVWFHHGCHPSTTSVCSLVREIDTRDRTLFFDIRRWIGYSTIGNWRRGTYRLSSTNAGSQRHQSEFYIYICSLAGNACGSFVGEVTPHCMCYHNWVTLICVISDTFSLHTDQTAVFLHAQRDSPGGVWGLWLDPSRSEWWFRLEWIIATF